MNPFVYSFQAKDGRGVVLAGRQLQVRVGIRQGAPAGVILFSETHSATTDAKGYAEITIGAGAPASGCMGDVRCGYDRYFLGLEIDAANNGVFVPHGTVEIPNVFAGGAVPAGSPASGVCNSFIISPQGNVGVGTLTPTYSLDVAGDIGTNGELHVQDAVLKVTGNSANTVNNSNIFLGWNNGTLTGSIAKYGNIVIGLNAGRDAENIMNNILIGTNAGVNLDASSNNNIFLGPNTGVSDGGSMVTKNICIGPQAGQEMKGKMGSNIFIGDKAGFDAENCESTVAIGKSAGNNNQANYNIFIGHNAGVNNTTGEANTFVGSMDTGAYNRTGRWNTFIGGSSGEDNVSGSYNTYVGHSSGSDSKGSGNTFVGHEAGIKCKDGNENVFIGHYAGRNENGSHRLYIANTDTSEPLIYGEFDSRKAAVNGDLGVNTKNPQRTLHVNGAMRLQPLSAPPANPCEGDIYMDASDHKLKVFDGTQWRACW